MSNAISNLPEHQISAVYALVGKTLKSGWRLTLLFIILLNYSAHCQVVIPKLFNGQSLNSLKIDSSIKKVAQTNEVTILFKLHSAWSFNIEYRIIAYSNNNGWSSYWYLNAEPINGLSNYPISQDSIRNIWQTCIKNELFYLDDEINDDKNCSQMIFDTHQYEFIIILDNKYKHISYYGPEFFLKNCPKRSQSVERKKIIKCASMFKSSFKMN